MKRSFLMISLIFFGLNSAKADFNDGVVAYLTGDYESAYNTMISMAETSNDAMAQYWLGVMYLKGQGVEQSYDEASKWLRKASEQAVPQAQFKLAQLYQAGQGVPQDNEYAYIWLSVGAAHNHTKSIEALNTARAQLSESELEEVNKAIPEFVARFGPQETLDPNKPVQLQQ